MIHEKNKVNPRIANSNPEACRMKLFHKNNQRLKKSANSFCRISQIRNIRQRPKYTSKVFFTAHLRVTFLAANYPPSPHQTTWQTVLARPCFQLLPVLPVATTIIHQTFLDSHTIVRWHILLKTCAPQNGVVWFFWDRLNCVHLKENICDHPFPTVLRK